MLVFASTLSNTHLKGNLTPNIMKPKTSTRKSKSEITSNGKTNGPPDIVSNAANQEIPKRKLWEAPGEIYSTIRGTLKLTEDGSNIFEFHDIRGWGLYAECKFNENMLDKAKSVLGEEIAIYGRCIYKSSTRFPYEIIDITDINVLVDAPHALRDLQKLKDYITGDKTTSEWLEEIRSSYE